MPRRSSLSFSSFTPQPDAHPEAREATAARRQIRVVVDRLIAASRSHDVVGDLDLRAEAVGLAGQDPVVGEIVRCVDVVLRQNDLALDALGRAGGAEALLAGGERVEPGGARGLQYGLPLRVG